jgi:hypothetical protein
VPTENISYEMLKPLVTFRVLLATFAGWPV